MEIKIENLGCLNGFYNNPDPKYLKCRKLKHILKREKIRECYNKFTCEECCIYYTVDSSG